jgi:hypothetical protein
VDDIAYAATPVPTTEYKRWWNGGFGVDSKPNESMDCPQCGAPVLLTPFIRSMYKQFRKLMCPACPDFVIGATKYDTPEGHHADPRITVQRLR